MSWHEIVDSKIHWILQHFFCNQSTNTLGNALARLTPRLQGKSSWPALYDIHKEDKILKQQLEQHVKHWKIFVKDEYEEMNGMQEEPRFAH